MKRSTFSSLWAVLAVLLLMMFTAPAFAVEISVATGGKGGFYHNGLYGAFDAKVKRFSDNEMECEYAVEKGTDGTLHNIKLVESGKANVAFVQMCGLIETGADVEVIGTIMYELAHLVVPKKGKVDDIGDLESKKGYSVGINSRSGSQVTFNVFKKFDKGYARANMIDYTKATRAISAMTKGELDSFFFVSAPGTKNIKRLAASGLKFADVDDSDFNDLKYNGKRVYEFVKVGKKLGYPNKFKTVRVPAVLIANKAWLAEEGNEDLFDILFDTVNAVKADVKAAKRLSYYPK